MSTNLAMLPGPALDDFGRSPIAPVLIRVPALDGQQSPLGAVPPRPRPIRPISKRRRRLRRELRMAAAAMICLMPAAAMALAARGFAATHSGTASGSPDRGQGLDLSAPKRGGLLASAESRAPDGDGLARRSWPTLSLEPLSADAEPAPPLVRPAGFLLPDDGHGFEESTHAGS